MTGSWGYPAETAQVVVPTELLGAVSDLIADPEAFMAAIVASAGGPRLVPVIPASDFDAVWLDPGEIVAVQEAGGGCWSVVTLRGGAQLTIHLDPLALFEKLKETHEDAH